MKKIHGLRFASALLCILTAAALLTTQALANDQKPPSSSAQHATHSAAQSAPYTTSLDYTIAVLPVVNGSVWDVTLKFQGNPSGTTTIEIPSKWAGREKLEDGIQDLKVWEAQSQKTLDLSAAASAELNADNKTEENIIKRVQHTPDASLTLNYKLVRIGQVYPTSQRDAYSPVLESSYFHVIGTGAWVMPKLDESAKIQCNLRWDIPADWTIANSFGVQQRVQTFVAKSMDLMQGLFVGGDFRLTTTMVSGKPVTLALRGDWGFFDQNLADLMQQIFAMERQFWSDFDYPNYLVAAIPVGNEVNGTNIGGTGLHNAFTMMLAPRTQVKDLRYLLTHELLHNWNPTRLGSLKEPEALMYWFSEGFTDYYTHKLMLKHGVYTPHEYARDVNRIIKAYTTTKERNVPNSRINEAFWTNPDVGKLPYQRGMLLAMQLNREITAASKGQYSLDTVMHDMYATAKRNNTPMTLDAGVIDAAISKRLGRSYQTELKKYVDDGATVDIRAADHEPCFEVKTVEFAQFDAGFDVPELGKTRVISGVTPDGPAYAAGLRNGMQGVSWSIYGGDTTKQIELTVKSDEKSADPTANKNIRISYYPLAKDKASVPQIFVKPGLTTEQLKTCAR